MHSRIATGIARSIAHQPTRYTRSELVEPERRRQRRLINIRNEIPLMQSVLSTDTSQQLTSCTESELTTKKQ